LLIEGLLIGPHFHRVARHLWLHVHSTSHSSYVWHNLWCQSRAKFPLDKQWRKGWITTIVAVIRSETNTPFPRIGSEVEPTDPTEPCLCPIPVASCCLLRGLPNLNYLPNFKPESEEESDIRAEILVLKSFVGVIHWLTEDSIHWSSQNLCREQPTSNQPTCIRNGCIM